MLVDFSARALSLFFSPKTDSKNVVHYFSYNPLKLNGKPKIGRYDVRRLAGRR